MQSLIPASAEELARERRKGVRVVGTMVVLLVGFFLASQFTPGWERVFLGAFVAGLTLLFFAWYAGGLFVAMDGGKPLDGDGCLRLAQLAKEYPEVQAYLDSVRAIERPVVWDDLWQVNGWLQHQRAEAKRQACRSLNGTGETL